MRFLLIFLLIAGGLQSQKSSHSPAQSLPQPSRSHYIQSPAPATAEEALSASQLLYPRGAYTFRPGGQRKAQTAEYWDFTINYRQIPIYGLCATAQKRNDPKLHWSFPHLPQDPDPRDHPSPPNLGEKSSNENIQVLQSPRKIWFVQNNRLQPAWSYTLSHQKSGRVTELLESQGEILHQQDLRRFSDSTVTGMVFYPDPLSSADKFYGGNFSDQNDNDHPALNNERRSVQFTADFRQGTFYLEHPMVVLRDVMAPSVPVHQGTSPTMNFTRSQSEFEDVNVFFHLTHFYDHTSQLGYPNIPNQQIEVDPHGANGADQSWYEPFNKRLVFGEGGVDDGEDADVIIHEWTHAMIDAAAAPGSPSTERSTLEEALGDYFAYSYSKDLAPNQTNRIFNWDGHNPFWPGRDAKSLKNYTQIQFRQSIYQHTDLMVSCLAEIESNLGPNTADQLVLETLFALEGGTTYRDFAYEMLASDSALNGAAHRQVIADAFIRRSVLPASVHLRENGKGPELYLSQLKNNGISSTATIHGAVELESVYLRSVDGRLLQSLKNPQKSQVEINLDHLPSGLFLIEVHSTSGTRKVFKVLRP